MKTIRIGSGAGFSGDRIEPAVELAERGDLHYLVFECLAERTIALAQQAKRRDPAQGYDPHLAERMRAVLGPCRARGVKIISNMGAANPRAAAVAIRDLARSLGVRQLRIAAIEGDDVLALVRGGSYPVDGADTPASALGERLVSANAYLGAQPIVAALAAGADVVVTGRVADPALYLAPQVHEFGWSMEDWRALGQGTVVGHLLECAGQVTGGYFADPGLKDVPDLARLGFPLAEVSADGSAVITKVAGSGGAVTAATCAEQLLYEVHDPSRYATPDVVADFSSVRIAEVGADRVRVTGGAGGPRPERLKASIGYLDGYVGEGQISYAGAGAVARGRLALAIVAERLKLTGVRCRELRCDLIGLDAVVGPRRAATSAEPAEVRARVVGRTETLRDAVRIGDEVEALYTNGPAGGGGVAKSAREVLALASALLPREAVSPTIRFEEV